jgi:hypothetical protein
MESERSFSSILVSGIGPLAVVAVLAACAARTIEVEVPPRVDLQSGTVGMVTFDAVPADKLAQYTTQRFISTIQAAQPGVRFIELGPARELLRSVGRERLDAETIQLIGRRHKVASLMAGNYEISDAKPRVTVDSSAVRASASVHIDMTARLWDTRDGATVWTRSRSGDWQVAGLRIEAGQLPSVSVSDPEERYGDFIRQLVRGITEDFRPHYERRRIEK